MEFSGLGIDCSVCGCGWVWVVCEFGCFLGFLVSGSCSFCDLRCALVCVVLDCLLTVCLQVGFCWFVCGSSLLRVVVS